MATACDSPNTLARESSLQTPCRAIERLTLKYASPGVQTDPDGFLWFDGQVASNRALIIPSALRLQMCTKTIVLTIASALPRKATPDRSHQYCF